MSLDIVVNEMDRNKHFWATYYLESTTTVLEAAKALAIGQSIGNPNARNKWETKEMVNDHSAKVYFKTPTRAGSDGYRTLHNFYEKGAIVHIGFPYANIDWELDGVSQLLCMVMGGQLDISMITKCQLLDIDLAPSKAGFSGPKWGLTGFRAMTRSFNKPMFGGIVKPKTGLNVKQHVELIKELLDGGVDFIKEDEILGNPAICPFADRVDAVAKLIDKMNYKAAVLFCINGDPRSVIEKANLVKNYNLDNLGVHANIWSGLGVYKDIRDLGVFQHYQKSGDKIITNRHHNFHIRWNVLCKLAGYCGVDTIHAGMIGGYGNDDEEEMKTVIKTLRDLNVCPALSCGMTAELIPGIVEKIGVDWMASSGGAIHSDPKGTAVGALKIRKAIDNLR